MSELTGIAEELLRASIMINEDDDGMTFVVPPEARRLAQPFVVERICAHYKKPVRIATYPR